MKSAILLFADYKNIADLICNFLCVTLQNNLILQIKIIPIQKDYVKRNIFKVTFTLFSILFFNINQLKIIKVSKNGLTFSSPGFSRIPG